jgi:hypothetical protein
MAWTSSKGSDVVLLNDIAGVTHVGILNSFVHMKPSAMETAL